MLQSVNTQFKWVKLASILSVALMSSIFVQSVSANGAEQVRKQLSQMIGPDAQSAEITKTEIDGLYQVQMGLTVVYMSANGQFLMNGNLIDLSTETNLTAQAQAKVRKAALAKVSASSMIVYPAENEKRTISVFTDIDCPYCKRLHKEIPKLNKAGVTVRYLAFPRAGIQKRTGELTESYKTMASVWCAKDPAKTMDDAMVGLPPEEKMCDNPIKDHLISAQELEINGTPNIIFDNGNIVPGFAPAHEILKEMKKS